jgi:hypothetical protein
MDREIENRNDGIGKKIEGNTAVNAATKTAAKRPYSSGHLMCRAPLWGVAGFLGCAYFAWISFSRVATSEYDWPHDLWTAATYIVWILLLIGLALDTRCLRERIFFGVLVINFAIGGGLTLWYNIPSADVRTARIGTGALWALAAMVSLTTLGSAPEQRQNKVRYPPS